MSRLTLRQFNYEVDDDPMAAIRHIAEAFNEDVDSRSEVLRELTSTALELCAGEFRAKASSLAENMLALSADRTDHFENYGESSAGSWSEGIVTTRTLGKFLIGKEFEHPFARPEYVLMVHNEEVDKLIEESRGDLWGTSRVAYVGPVTNPDIDPLPDLHLVALLMASYENMLTVANDRKVIWGK